jgi:hypothetical protein
VDYGDVMMKMVFVIWFLFWIVMGERKILKAMDIFLSYAADQFSSPPFSLCNSTSIYSSKEMARR